VHEPKTTLDKFVEDDELMTHTENGVVYIIEEPPGKCELCGAIEETRPYGPNGEEVCFSCGMKDEEAARKQFQKRIAGA